jgi:hypothetical protein
MFDMFTSRNIKKIFKYPLSRPTTMSDQIVGLRECWLSNLLDIWGGICPTWEYDRWYTWSVLYMYPCFMSNILWSMRICKRTFFPVCRMSWYVNTLVYFYLAPYSRQEGKKSIFNDWSVSENQFNIVFYNKIYTIKKCILLKKITGWIDLQYKIIITKYLNIAGIRCHHQNKD